VERTVIVRLKALWFTTLALGLAVSACAPATAPPASAPTPSAAPASQAAPQASPKSPPLASGTTQAPSAASTPTPRPATGTGAVPQSGSEQPRYGGIVKAISAFDIATLDVISSSSTTVQYVTRPVYSTLLRVDPAKPTEVVGDLATNWEITDGGKVYVFTLRDGVRWHDGQPFTAADVVFSIDRMRNPPKGITSVRKDLWQTISAVEAVDARNVKITLKAPNASLFSLLAAAPSQIVPKHVLEKDPKAITANMVGTGPYKFVKNEKGIVFEAKRNENYYVKGRPYLDGVQYYIIPDAATGFAALRAHRVNFGGWGGSGISVSQSQQIQREGLQINMVRYPSIGGQFIILNQRPGRPFADERVRKAFALATDVTAAIQLAQEGLGRRVGTFVNPASALPEAEVLKYPQYQPVTDKKLAEAKALLTAAGYPNGLDLDGSGYSQATYVNAMEVFAQQAKSVFRIKIKGLETAAAYDGWKAGRFDMAVAPGSPAMNDPSVRAAEFYVSGAGSNYAGINDKEVDRYYAKSLEATDPLERRKIVQEWERYMLDHYLIWYLTNNEYIMPMWKEIRDKYIPDLTSGHEWQDVWIAQ